MMAKTAPKKGITSSFSALLRTMFSVYQVRMYHFRYHCCVFLCVPVVVEKVMRFNFCISAATDLAEAVCFKRQAAVLAASLR